MKPIATLPLSVLALAALAALPACSSRRTTVAAPPSVVQAPLYADPDAATKSEVAAVDEKVGQVSDQVAALAQRMDEMRSQPAIPAPAVAPAPMQAPPSMAAAPSGDIEASRFVQTLRSRGVSAVEQAGNTVTVRITDAFRPGSDSLKGDVELAKTLQALAEGLQLAPASRVQVVGHSDLTPIKKSKDKWADNTALSRARAQAVARVLTENGVRASIDVDGRGESEPLVSPEKDKNDQSRNRRVEVQVSF